MKHISGILVKSLFFFIATGGITQAETQFDTASHAIALYGDPLYDKDFTHFTYVNPQAPKGGSIKLATTLNFDSLNPFILKGVKAPGISMVFESLMTGSLDEPATMYGLIAESVSIGKDYSSARFTLRKQARFSDGTPITPADVVFSFEKLAKEGDPAYQITLAPIQDVKQTGTHEVTFTFKETGNRELPQVAAGMPIFSKAYYTTNAFDKTSLSAPLGSGPYLVDKVDQGRSISYKRDPNYWGSTLPVNVGQYNFDKVHYTIYKDETVALEALKAGEFDYHEEYIARNWATAYSIPAIKTGKFIKREVKHNNAAGMQGFIFNLRRNKFSDIRVRQAIGLTLDFEWMNKTIFYSAYLRTSSYFENTSFAARGLPDAAELALLAPMRDQLPETVFTTAYSPPKTDGSGNARENLILAQKLLNDAGWVIKDGKRVHKDSAEPLTVEFLLHQPSMERVVAPMRKNLARLGIEASIRNVDSSQYQKRLDEADFDMISLWVNRGVSFPGNEQVSYWHSKQADIAGSNNIAGVKNPAIDSLLALLIKAQTLGELTSAARALDRVMLHQHYVIPHWFVSNFRIAYWDKFGIPTTTPKYNVGLFTWWAK